MGFLFTESPPRIDGPGSSVDSDGPCKTYTCARCRCPLTTGEHLISRAFQSRSGKAYLFNTVVNVSLDPPVPRVMLTGHFTVRDVDCKRCAARLGWYYEGAAAADQRYKVGRTCLEREALSVESDGGSTTSGGDVSDDDDACA